MHASKDIFFKIRSTTKLRFISVAAAPMRQGDDGFTLRAYIVVSHGLPT